MAVYEQPWIVWVAGSACPLAECSRHAPDSLGTLADNTVTSMFAPAKCERGAAGVFSEKNLQRGGSAARTDRRVGQEPMSAKRVPRRLPAPDRRDLVTHVALTSVAARCLYWQSTLPTTAAPHPVSARCLPGASQPVWAGPVPRGRRICCQWSWHTDEHKPGTRQTRATSTSLHNRPASSRPPSSRDNRNVRRCGACASLP